MVHFRIAAPEFNFTSTVPSSHACTVLYSARDLVTGSILFSDVQIHGLTNTNLESFTTVLSGEALLLLCGKLLI